MKIIMTLLVRDEEDIIKNNIEFHKSNGVDFFIVTDNNSDDSTTEILKEYEKNGVIHYILEKKDNYNQHEWVTHMARLAYTQYNADWVINNDADEFWMPHHGNLKTIFENIPGEINTINVDRYNFVPRINNKQLPFYKNMVYREKKSFNSDGKKLPSKAIHRGNSNVIVHQGNHSVSGIQLFLFSDIIFKRLKQMLSNPPKILFMPTLFRGLNMCIKQICKIEKRSHKRLLKEISIFHFPIRTHDQFYNKISKGGAALERNKELPQKSTITWRNLYKKYVLNDNLDEYLSEKFYSNERIDSEINQRIIVKDERLLKFFEHTM